MTRWKRMFAMALACVVLGTGVTACQPKDAPAEETGQIEKTQEESSSSVNTGEPASEESQSVIIQEVEPYLDGPEIGESIIFGNYLGEEIKWDVLDRDNNSVLLISHYLIDSAFFDGSNWQNSKLRSWLNGDFYGKAFSTEEQKKLRPMAVLAEKRQEDGTIKESYKVSDKVTLLSQEEVEKYYLTDEAREAYPSVRYANQILQNKEGGGNVWWLRSPIELDEDFQSYHYDTVTCVDDDGEYVHMEIRNTLIPRGVRPVICMALGETGKNGSFVSTLAETIKISRSCMGMNSGNAVDFMDDLFGIGVSSARGDYLEGNFTPLDGSMEIEGVSFKRIHFFYDEEDRVKEIDFCLTENQSLYMGVSESEEFSKDKNLPAQEAYEKLIPRLRSIMGNSGEIQKIDWIKAEAGESLTWNAGDYSVAAIWGKNCYSLAGNQQFELQISSDKDFYPGKNVTWSGGAQLDPEMQGVMDLVAQCIGQDPDVARKLFKDLANVDFGEMEYYEAESPESPNEYICYKDFSLAGISFNAISIMCSQNSGKVYGLYFLKRDDVPSEQLEKYYKSCVEKLSQTYGRPKVAQKDECKFDVGDGTMFEIGGNFSDYFGTFHFFFEKEELK